MIFKIVFENEIHRLRRKFVSFEELLQEIQNRFGEQLPESIAIEYLDTDSDKVRINCQDDFSILLEELSSSKAVKIFIREDLNQSALVLAKQPSIEILSENDQNEEQVSEEEEVKNQEESDSAEEKPSDSNTDSDSPAEHEKQFNNQTLKLDQWEFWLDAYTKKDNPLEILWKLKSCVQRKVRSLRQHLRKTEPKTLKAMNFKQIKKDCRSLVKQARMKCPETEVNFDDMKAHLLSLEGSEDLKSWIIFKVTIQQKINSTRSLIKSIPELREKFKAFHQEKKEHKKGRHHRHHGHHGKFAFWKKFKNGCKNKKREWFKKKFQEKFDKSMQKALPEIALQVAQILKSDSIDQMKIEAPVKQQKTEIQEGVAVHHGYICDGCGVSPIVGVCYMSSVTKNYDLCAKCEATVPHKHPLLKLNHPDQRPHALFAIVNEEGQKPFVPGRDDPAIFQEQAKETFNTFFKDCEKAKKKEVKKEEKKLKKAEKKALKAEKKAEKKAMKAEKKAEKKAMKAEKKLIKKQIKKANHLAKNEENSVNMMAIFQIPENMREKLFKWVRNQRMYNLNRLANKFIRKNMLAKFCPETTETKPVEETQDTQGGDSEEEVLTPEGDEETEPEPVVVVKEIDQVALANTNQLMEIFSVAQQHQDDVYDWVVAKNNTNVEELVNYFLEEKLGKF